MQKRLFKHLGTFISLGLFTVALMIINFKGLRTYKEKFSPLWRPKYLACPRGLVLPRVLTNLVALTSGSLKGSVTK